MRAPRTPGRRSSALIITLSFLALVSLLVIGFVNRAGMEVISSRSHLGGIQAALFAEAGTDTALTRIRSALTATNASGVATNAAAFWVTQPGRIILIGGGNPAPGTVVDLSSGAAGAATDSASVADLNPPSLDTANKYLINSDPALSAAQRKMYLRWIYVRQDGTLDTSVPPATPAGDPNPVVGRYAFWADDESAKINLNTAWARGAQNPGDPFPYPPAATSLSDPSFVNLAALPLAAGDAAALRQAATGTNHFNSLPEAGRADSATLPGLIATQGFSLTHYNHSPDLDMLNEPRLVLTTGTANLPLGMVGNSTNYINILAVPGADPGLIGNLDSAKVATVVTYLNKQLMRTDWPFMPGQSFLSKYGNDTNAITLISMNIVDYVRSVESTNSYIEPLVGRQAGGTFTLDNSGPLISGGRRPYLSEVGAYVNAGGTQIESEVELTLPTIAGTPTLWNNILVHVKPLTLVDALDNSTNTISSSTMTVTANDGPDYAYPAGMIVVKHLIPATGPRPASLNLCESLLSPTGHVLDRGIVLAYAVDPAAVTESAISSYAADDPLFNQSASDWRLLNPNTFGRQNLGAITQGIPPGRTVVPRQDTLSSGNVAIGACIRGPKGSAINPSGLVLSVAELGFVPTGMTYTNAPAAVGAPYRTIRLQPQAAAGVLPDWAMLDLFSVPVPSSPLNQPFVRPPDQASWGGRINLNSQIYPFTSLSRPAPLAALLLGANTTGGTGTTVIAATTSLVTNLMNFCSPTASLNTASLAAGGANYGYPFFLSPGEIVEVKGVADGGEANEPFLQEILGQATVRGNVFSIYSVGQALKEDRGGTIHVVGERRLQTIVERVEPSASAAANGAPPGIQFLPVYSRELE